MELHLSKSFTSNADSQIGKLAFHFTDHMVSSVNQWMTFWSKLLLSVSKIIMPEIDGCGTHVGVSLANNYEQCQTSYQRDYEMRTKTRRRRK